MKNVLYFMILLLLNGCLGVPKSVTPVSGFELPRYLGKWYEIARLDHPFERGLEQVSAEYSLRPDGGVRVKNRGFSPEKNEWREAEGKAFFAGDPNEGFLKVSFFGPFYGSYIVFGLDHENYQYAFVCGPDTSYLWLLSRTPTVDAALRTKFTNQASQAGFDTNDLIFVKQ